LPAVTTGVSWTFANLSTDVINSYDLIPKGGVTIFAVLKCRPFKWWSGINMPCGAPLEIRTSDGAYWYNISNMWGVLGFSIYTKSGGNGVSYGQSNASAYMPAIYTFKASDSQLITKINGKLVASSNTVGSIGTFDNPLQILIGYSNGGSPLYRYYKGFIGELIVYGNPIPDSKVSLVEQYLSQKWRIPLD